jgi:hypothetical protein
LKEGLGHGGLDGPGGGEHQQQRKDRHGGYS